MDKNSIKYGTTLADHIIGDSANNVIFSLAGNDTINGRDGDDRIVAGLGNDLVNGTGGNDVIYGDEAAFVNPIENDGTFFGGAEANGWQTWTTSPGVASATTNADGELVLDTGGLAGSYGGWTGARNEIGINYNSNESYTFTCNTSTNDDVPSRFVVRFLVENENGGYSQLGFNITYPETTGSEVSYTIAPNSNLAQYDGQEIVIQIEAWSNGTEGQVGTESIFVSNVKITSTDPAFEIQADNETTIGGDDILNGGGENDKIFGLGGDDRIDGGTGADNLDGGTGQDTIIGGSGNDVIQGGAGDDVIYADNIDGNLYDNHLTGFIMGEDFDLNASYLTYLGGVEFTVNKPTLIRFVDDDNRLDDDPLSEYITGTGKVEINGQLYSYDADFVAKYSGSDGETYEFIIIDVDLDGNGHIVGTEENGKIIVPMGAIPPADVKLTSLNYRTFNPDGSEMWDFKNLQNYSVAEYNDEAMGGSGDDIIYGGLGDDNLRGDDGQDKIYGGVGNDAIAGGDGFDELYGDAGNDSIFGNEGSDSIYGGEGADTLFGDDGNDEIYGGAGNDRVEGGEGSDFSYGGAGDDIVRGGSGNDVVYGEDGNDRVYGQNGNDFVYGGAGNDRVFGGNDNDIIHGNEGNDLLFGDKGNDEIFGEEGRDTLRGNDGDDFVYGGLDNDRVFGDDGNDSVYGDDGNDRVFGGAGDDFVYGGNGADEVRGDAGNDYVYGGIGNDNLHGDEGNDRLEGGDGKDHLRGDAGDDILIGGNGDDRLIGGEGDDLLEGGAGNDVFLFKLGDGNDRIADFQDGRDLIGIEGGLDINDVTVTQVGSDTLIEYGSDSILLENVNHNDIDWHDFYFPEL